MLAFCTALEPRMRANGYTTHAGMRRLWRLHAWPPMDETSTCLVDARRTWRCPTYRRNMPFEHGMDLISCRSFILVHCAIRVRLPVVGNLAHALPLSTFRRLCYRAAGDAPPLPAAERRLSADCAGS